MIKHDGAKMWPQRFPEKSLLRWKMLLNDSPESNVVLGTV